MCACASELSLPGQFVLWLNSAEIAHAASSGLTLNAENRTP